MRSILMVALLGAGGIGLLGWTYLQVARVPGGADGTGREGALTSQSAARRDAHVTKGRAMLEAGDNAGAVAALDRALEEAPGDAEALALQVRALRAQRHYTAARSTARRILDSFPQSPLAHILLGSIAIQEGDAPTARRDLERAVALDTSSALALAQLGALDLMEGRVLVARDRATQALALEPENLTALRILARTSRSVPVLASIFRRLLAVNPDDHLTRSWLGVIQASSAPEINYISPIETEVAVPCEGAADGRLYLRARVGPIGRLRLLVDTGGSGLMLSEKLARGMGMRLSEFSESAGVGGMKRHSHPILIDRLEVGGMRGRAMLATASNLPAGVDGIINPMIFAPAGSGVIMEIRPAQRMLVFARRGAASAAQSGARWVTVPYLADNNHIIFSIVLGGRSAMALLDTGSSVEMVDRTLLERMPGARVLPADGMTDSLIGFGGHVENVATVDRVMLRIAGRDFATQRLFVLDLNDEAFRFPVDLDAIVGMSRLGFFDLRVDPGAGQLSFRPHD